VSFLIIIVGLLLLMWVLMVRPQRRKQAAQQQMLDELSDGDEILTAGGFYGTVRSIDGDDLHVEIAPGTEIRVARRAVAAVIPPEGEEWEGEELEAAAEDEAGDEAEPVKAASDGDSPPESRS
jgi:preprotein translocase subunit YajC